MHPKDFTEAEATGRETLLEDTNEGTAVLQGGEKGNKNALTRSSTWQT